MGEHTTKLHLYKPTVGENVSLVNHFNNNWDELESRLGNLYGLTEAEINQLKNLGTNEITADIWGIVAGLTTHPLGGGGTAGEGLRIFFIAIADGTNANTLKVSTEQVFNGDVISEEDNLAKDGSTTSFTLDSAGRVLGVKSGALSGDCIGAIGSVWWNCSDINLTVYPRPVSGDLIITFYDSPGGTSLDMTVLVDVGDLRAQILYITGV